MKRNFILFFTLGLMSLQANSQQYMWSNRMGSSSNELAKVMTVDNSGNAIIAGTFWGTVDFNPSSGVTELTSNGMRDAFLAKYSGSGDLMWAFSFGDIYDDEIIDLKIDGEGNIIITGSYMGTIDLDPGSSNAAFTAVMDNNDGFIAKYDGNGNYIWGNSFGSLANDYGKHLAINSSNDIYMAGYFNYSVDFDFGSGINEMTGQFDIFVAKYDKDGNHSWAFKIGANGQEYTHGLGLDKNENLLVYGRFQQIVDFDPGNGTTELTASSNHDLFLSKYTPSGGFLWAKQISGNGSKYGEGITVDPSDNIYLAGSFSQTLDMDPSGTVVNENSSGTSPFILKLNGTGEYVWHHIFKSSGGSSEMGNIRFLNDYIFAAGTYSGTMTDTVGAASVSFPAVGDQDLFIAKLSANTGKNMWLHAVGGPGLDLASDICPMADERFYVCGGFTGTCDFNFNATETNNLASDGEIDIFLAKYNESTVSVENNTNETHQMTIFPNPNDGSFFINSTNKSTQFELLDFTGKLIQTIRTQNQNSHIFTNLPAGIYLIKEKGSNQAEKLIIK